MDEHIFDKVHDVDLQKTMDPAKYVGCAKEQVETFLSKVVRPILDANKELLGVKAEINV